MLPDGNSNLGKLFYQDIQAAEDSKGALNRRWAEIKRTKEVYLERSRKVQWKTLLVEFNSEIKGVLAKCNATQGVLKRRQEREKRMVENARDTDKFFLSAQRIRQEMQAMARVIIEVGEIYSEVNQQITEITQVISRERLKISRDTLSGKSISELAST